MSTRSQGSATVAIVAGVLLAAGAAAFALLWRSPAPLRAEARVDTSGVDLLHLTCATCPDGTQLRIGEGSPVVVSAQTADLPLATPLQVGSNLFNVDIDRPANGRDEKVSLVVKIGYRIRPDLSLLDTEHPLLRVAVDGTPGATVEVDGKPLTLGTDGKGAYDVDITSECQRASDEAKTVERAVSYRWSASTARPKRGR